MPQMAGQQLNSCMICVRRSASLRIKWLTCCERARQLVMMPMPKQKEKCHSRHPAGLSSRSRQLLVQCCPAGVPLHSVATDGAWQRPLCRRRAPATAYDAGSCFTFFVLFEHQNEPPQVGDGSNPFADAERMAQIHAERQQRREQRNAGSSAAQPGTSSSNGGASSQPAGPAQLSLFGGPASSGASTFSATQPQSGASLFGQSSAGPSAFGTPQGSGMFGGSSFGAASPSVGNKRGASPPGRSSRRK